MSDFVLWGVMPTGTPIRITEGSAAHCRRELDVRAPGTYWSGLTIVAPGAAYPHARHGWVTVRPGVLRPAYMPGRDPITDDVLSTPHHVVYSPEAAAAWRDAPAGIACTFLLQYVAGEWRPFTVPTGYRIAS